MTKIITNKKPREPTNKITSTNSDENKVISTIITEKKIPNKTYIKSFYDSPKNFVNLDKEHQKIIERNIKENLKYGETAKEQCNNFMKTNTNLKYVLSPKYKFYLLLCIRFLWYL